MAATTRTCDAEAAPAGVVPRAQGVLHIQHAAAASRLLQGACTTCSLLLEALVTRRRHRGSERDEARAQTNPDVQKLGRLSRPPGWWVDFAANLKSSKPDTGGP